MRRAANGLGFLFSGFFTFTLIALLFYFLGVEPLLGKANQMNIWICICLVCGGMLMMAVYNAALRLFTKREKAAQYFSLFCVGQSIRFFFIDGSIGAQLFPDLPPLVILLGLRYIPFALGVSGLVFFVYEIYGEGRSKKVKYLLVAALIGANLAIALLGLDHTIGRALIGLPVGVFFHSVCIYVIVRSPEFKRNHLSVLYLAGFAMYCVSFFITATSIQNAPYIAVMFNFIFAVIHAVLLSDRFARAVRAVEEANVRLEDKVLERTAELTAANRQLAASEKSIKELVSGISHDLKTPLTVLGLNLEMLRDEEALQAEDFRRYVDIAYQKNLDLARLLRNLFDAARMESGKVVYSMAWTPLGELLNRAYAKYAGEMEAAGITPHVRFLEDCLVWLDAERIWNVLDNLVGNALRYTPAGGAITIGAEKAGEGFAAVTVSDTGCGVAPEHLPRIFDRFYKADPSRAGSDSGLGLYIVKTMAEGMEGSVSARSEAGKGFAVTVRLRAKEAGERGKGLS